jgi:hypothetical protein
VFIFSTEEVTIAAMRKGRDGMRCSIPTYLRTDNRTCYRYDDVPQRRRCYHMLRVLLGVLHRCDERMAQIPKQSSLPALSSMILVIVRA